MKLFKRNPFGHILVIKKWLIRILGLLSHRRFKGFNKLNIECENFCLLHIVTNQLSAKHADQSETSSTHRELSTEWPIFISESFLFNIGPRLEFPIRATICS